MRKVRIDTAPQREFVCWVASVSGTGFVKQQLDNAVSVWSLSPPRVQWLFQVPRLGPAMPAGWGVQRTLD